MHWLRPTSVLLACGLGFAAMTAPLQVALAGPAKAPRPGHWTEVTGKLSNINDVGLARGKDGVLHVLWTSGSTGHVRVQDTPIKADGVVGRPVTIEAHIFSASDPDATATPTGLAVFWNAVKANSPTSPIGTFEATRPSRGGSWHVSFVTAAAQSWTSTIAAASGTGGIPWTAFGNAGGMGIVVQHIGHRPVQLNFPTCCVTNQGIGTDSKTGTAFATYLSLMPRHSGLFAVRLTAVGRRAGASVKLPGSDIGGSVLVSNQRVTATGLGGNRPGVYVTYRTGHSAARDVVLYKIGAHRAVTVARLDAPQVGSGSTLAADSSGRLWLAWFRGEHNTVGLWVRRAKIGASQFGQIKKIALPRGTSYIWKVYINAQARKLDVLALMTVRGKIAYWATQVLPPRQ